ncbi:peptidoglycan D,D-transpeptidase FtsI family protein [Faecalibacterium gallinarum]|uniref:Stage V sporulation protein D n=1 Tax=Faecalibacterium gallinarum TaxID=2903556 RepID=A0AA37MY10_9FIRM|nr:penicillin-binding transpeptidase domain-containing protein [Faecalibacterium gallinarum]GJN63480.1 stage V sporulation protein D [Faecalibacterium gallinarum]
MGDWIRPVPERALRTRARLVAGLFCAVCFLGLAVRLFYLQLVGSGWYSERALGQQLQDTVVPADRGKIYSADGTLLAANSSCWTLRASPREMPEDKLELAARGLAQILELDEADLLEKFQQRSSNDCLLRYRVDRTMADAVRDFCEENQITGIRINQDSKRWYPEGEFLASVLGFTNVDNAGVSGLELEYDDVLTGENGVVLTAVNAWGYTLEQSYATEQYPVEGNSLVLTIDANIQRYLENALNYAVQEHNVAARAVGIVMDVNTGAVLAMSTTPAYDPNQPRVIYDEATRAAVDALSGEERAAALQLAQQTQWRNKAVSDLYEPGSVFKLITCAAGLDAGVIQAGSTFYCGESISVAGTKFHCANHRSHGTQSVTLALMNSCNQSFIQIGARLGKEAFCDYFAAFGLREATGIDLPAEPKKSLYYTAEQMGPVELASCAFGQSSKVSYIEMAAAVCAVVNGGNLMRPYVVSEIRDPEGETLDKIEPVCTRRVIKEETSITMRKMMEAVVEGGGGQNAKIAGYRVGGKSGTSQKLDSEDETARIASFVAVAPIDDPQFLCLVCLDEPHSWTTAGGSLSAPVCAEVLEQTLVYKGVPRAPAEDEAQNTAETAAELPADGDSFYGA